MSNLLEITAVTKRFGGITALDQVDYACEKGHIIGLLGPNGSGKTTLLKALNGLLTVEGSILIDGNPVGPVTKGLVSYLPDRNYFDEKMTVKKAVAFFKDFYADFDETKALTLLADFGIDINQKLKHLSKGNKEKVQLILAISRKARLYLFDEPLGGVDPAARSVILDLILKNYDPEATVIISTHLIADIESIFDEVIFLKDGKVVLSGDADTVREEKGKSIDELFREVFQCSVNF